MRHMPQSARPTEVFEWDSGRQRRVLDELAAEEPLEIRVNGEPISVTMRTPGDDFELAAGFLITEGVITRREQIARIAFALGPDAEPSGNLVDVTLAAGEQLDQHRLDRHFVASSSCGPDSAVGWWSCLRYISGDAGVPLFECGGCDGCQQTRPG